MLEKIKQANEFIQANQSKVDLQYRDTYHLMPPIGWMNDPNGFVYFKRQYHLFYQFYPYDSVWGPMHWGHAVSDDLVSWEHLPVALAPSEPYDCDGCFSGSALVKDDNLYLIYTGHVENDTLKQEVQCLAVSTDGIHFEKYNGNPIITASPEDPFSSEDFRDPKLFEKDGLYYTVVASKTSDERGQIILFKSSDLFSWQFFSVLLEGDAEQGIMWECPDLFHLDGKDVLILSPIQMKHQEHLYVNTSSTVAFIGEVDWGTGKFSLENFHEIDGGLDFYAPQTCINDKDERYMVAWMQMWNRDIPPHQLTHGWSGAMTLPRKLSVIDNQLIQHAPKTIYPYIHQDKQKITVKKVESEIRLDNVVSDAQYFKVEIDLLDSHYVQIQYAQSKAGYLDITYSKETELFTVSRANIGHSISGLEEPSLVSRSVKLPLVENVLSFEFFRDTSSVEFFLQDGKTMSFTFYEQTKGKSLRISCDKTALVTELSHGEIVTSEGDK